MMREYTRQRIDWDVAVGRERRSEWRDGDGRVVADIRDTSLQVDGVRYQGRWHGFAFTRAWRVEHPASRDSVLRCSRRGIALADAPVGLTWRTRPDVVGGELIDRGGDVVVRIRQRDRAENKVRPSLPVVAEFTMPSVEPPIAVLICEACFQWLCTGTAFVSHFS
jgi:hypothetical protein